MAYTNKRLSSDSFPGPFGESREEGSSLGTIISTSASLINILPGTTHLSLVTRNYAGATVIKYLFNPYLLMLTTTNGGQAFTDSSAAAQGTAGGRALVLDALPATPSGYLYIGSHLPWRGMNVTVNQANANASVLSANFWNGTAWAAFTGFTDGTANAGATFGQTGTITWTVPTTWAKTLLPSTWAITTGQPLAGWAGFPSAAQVSPNIPVPPLMFNVLAPYSEKARYWAQFTVSATLSNPTSASLVLPFNRVTAASTGSDHVVSDVTQERVWKGPDGVTCIEALTDAGTANLIVNGYNDAAVGGF